MGSKLKNVQEYIQETVQNIRNDRSVTNNLLTDLLLEMKKTSDVDNHKQLGLIASKYVETLQRSNEQLVKIAAIAKLNMGPPKVRCFLRENITKLLTTLQVCLIMRQLFML